MSDVFETKAKKISADQVEVVDSSGAHVAGKEAPGPTRFSGSGMHVVKIGGPISGLLGVVMLPILIPLIILGLFLLTILSMFFGRAFFRTSMAKVMKR